MLTSLFQKLLHASKWYGKEHELQLHQLLTKAKQMANRYRVEIYDANKANDVTIYSEQGVDKEYLTELVFSNIRNFSGKINAYVFDNVKKKKTTAPPPTPTAAYQTTLPPLPFVVSAVAPAQPHQVLLPPPDTRTTSTLPQTTHPTTAPPLTRH